ncbi:MAG: ribonuclease Z [Bacteroidetes bacterium]|nr:MAG: ribonuclease Z [Bacteroidota bacterium]RLD84210.1 MAG: ribonuclease Z [Bacteroidota bacterium]
MTFSVTILGSSSALPTSNRFPTAHLFNSNERFFLIDCGEGTQIQLRRFRLKFSKINHIFISHLHGDHYFGLFGLISSFSLLGRKSDLHIYAHTGLEKMIECQFKENTINYNIVFHKISPQKVAVLYEDKTLKISTFPLKHRIPANGFLFKERERELNLRKDVISKFNLSIKDIQAIKKGSDYLWEDEKLIKNNHLTYPPDQSRSYAFCSDTAYYQEVVGFIKNVDLLYHEATFAEDMKEMAKKTTHSTAKQAAEIASKANVGKLLIGHFSSRYKDEKLIENEAKEVFENTETVIEGKTYSVDIKRKA